MTPEAGDPRTRRLSSRPGKGRCHIWVLGRRPWLRGSDWLMRSQQESPDYAPPQLTGGATPHPAASITDVLSLGPGSVGLCAQWRQERSAGPRFRRLRTEDTTSDTSAGRLPDKALIHLHRPLPGRPPGRDERLYESWVHPRRHLPSLCDSGLSYKMETDLGGSSSDSCRGPELGPSPAHHPPAPPLGVASPTRPRPPVSGSTPEHSPAHTRTQPRPGTAPPTSLRPGPRTQLRPPGFGSAPEIAPPTSLRPRP